jgi:pimeloyl-ACP methyl ester carboxylesterase
MACTVSRDGTAIAFDRLGEGQPLILVDGALCSRAFGPMPALAPLLARHFAVYTYDRRGRNDSGDTLPYGVEREIDDLASMIDVAGGSACVYGISSGAALALERRATRSTNQQARSLRGAVHRRLVASAAVTPFPRASGTGRSLESARGCGEAVPAARGSAEDRDHGDAAHADVVEAQSGRAHIALRHHNRGAQPAGADHCGRIRTGQSRC